MDDKEGRILKAATGLFAKYGLRKTTVDEIAKAAGVGKGTIYLFFSTKEDLFAAVVRREGAELLECVRAAVRKQSTAKEKLRTFILTRFQTIEELVTLHEVSTDVLAELRPEIAEARKEYVLAERGLIQGILEEGVERQELEMSDIPLATLTISATMQALEAPWVFEGRELRLERKVDALLGMFIKELKR